MPFCVSCGTAVEDDAAFCSHCGKRTTWSSPNQRRPYVSPAFEQNLQKGNRFAISGFVLGILSIPTCITIFPGFVLGILAIIFGSLSIHSENRKFAYWALALGVIGFVLSMVAVGFDAAAIQSVVQNAVPADGH